MYIAFHNEKKKENAAQVSAIESVQTRTRDHLNKSKLAKKKATEIRAYVYL